MLPFLAKQMALRASAIFLVKLMGFFTKITMFRILGSTGVGLYQITYSMYVIILTCIVGGIPASLALSTALNEKLGWRYFKLLAVVFVFLGLVSALGCYSFAGSIAVYFGDARLEQPIRCLAPALLIVPVLHLMRGFLQGKEYYGYIALSELIEQTVRVITMIMLVSVWINYGVEVAVSGAVFGAVTGSSVALLFLVIMVNSSTTQVLSIKEIDESKSRKIAKSAGILALLQLSFYIAVSRFVMPTLDFFDALIIPHRLQLSGVSANQAISILGELCGMVTPIVYLPLIITASLTHILYAKIAVDWQDHNKERFYRRTNFAVEVGWLWGFGSALVLYLFADDISQLIFGTFSVAKGIRYLSVIPFLAAVREVTTSVLWTVGKKSEPVIALALGVFTSIIVIYWLSALPGYGYQGVAIGIVSFEIVTTLCNVWNVCKLHKQIFSWVPLFTGTFLLLSLLVPTSILITKYIHSLQIPDAMQTLTKLFFLFGCILFYIFIRFLKKSYIKFH